MRKNLTRVLEYIKESHQVDAVFDSTAQMYDLPLSYGWFSHIILPPIETRHLVYFASSHTAARSFDIAKVCRDYPDLKTLFIVAQNDAGGRSLMKLADSFALTYTSDSRAHCRVLYIDMESQRADKTVINTALEQGNIRQREDGLWTQSGVFSADHTDAGSLFLLENINTEILQGVGADFGCGIGELARGMLQKNKTINLHAIDYDSRAIACARKNLDHFHGRITYHRWDARDEITVRDLDFIVMNPPFHTGKETSLDLGKLFFRRAREMLKNKGLLIAVANRHLAYEHFCREIFSDVEIIATNNQFKILRCVA